jgi:hypothetical protein
MRAIRPTLVAIFALLTVTDQRIGAIAANATETAPAEADADVPGPLRPAAPSVLVPDRNRPAQAAPRIQEAAPRRPTLPPQPARAAPAAWTGALAPIRRGGEAKGRIAATIATRDLKLTDFSVSDRPTLEIWLSAAEPNASAATLQETKHVSLGRLRKPRGDQTYRFPAELDLSIYHTVVIWSRHDRAPDAAARLMPTRAN